MAGESDESAGAAMMVFETLDYGDDFVPIDDPYQEIFQMDEPRESRTLELPRHDDGVGYSSLGAYQLLAEGEALLFASRHAAGLEMEPRDDDDEERFLTLVRPRLPRAGPSPFLSHARVGGFGGGGVAAPAATAVVSLAKVKHGEPGDGERCGTSADSTGCVICVQDYEVGDELSVVPCSGRHRFHQECLTVWLARKPLCPLCRHALPAEVQRCLN